MAQQTPRHGETTEAPRVEQLKDRIDRGAGRDKVAAFDPAAVPLGADDEAAGTPPSPEALRIAAATEARPEVDPGGALRNSAASHYPSDKPEPRSPLSWLLGAAVIGIVGGLAVWLLV